MENKSGCLVCGEDLVYQSDDKTVECYYCKGTFQSNVTCIKNHYVCDKCHSQSGVDLIGTYCLNSKSVNPLEMAIEIMQSEKIKMHGPEHHFLVPAVLISAYCNAINDDSKPVKLGIARKRAEKIPGGLWYSWKLWSWSWNWDIYQHYNSVYLSCKRGMEFK